MDEIMLKNVVQLDRPQITIQ